jgi:hypothetical protein
LLDDDKAEIEAEGGVEAEGDWEQRRWSLCSKDSTSIGTALLPAALSLPFSSSLSFSFKDWSAEPFPSGRATTPSTTSTAFNSTHGRTVLLKSVKSSLPLATMDSDI